MHSMYESPIASTLSQFSAFGPWSHAHLLKRRGCWGWCGNGAGRGHAGFGGGVCSQDLWVLGMAQKVKGWRRNNLLRPHVCVSGAGQSWGAGETGGAWAGWAHTCVLNIGSVYVSTSLRCTTSRTRLQRWNVTLETLLSCCPSYGL